MSMSKPIEIVAVSGGFNVYINTIPIVNTVDGGCSFDRVKANCGKNPKKTQLTDVMTLFPDPGKAMHIAHMVGRYILKMGDFVSGYTSFVPSPDMSADTFWAKAFGRE